jgi:hypothetical protein
MQISVTAFAKITSCVFFVRAEYELVPAAGVGQWQNHLHFHVNLQNTRTLTGKLCKKCPFYKGVVAKKDFSHQ